MTLNSLTDNTLTQLNSEDNPEPMLDRAAIVAKAKAFDLQAPVSDEEFDDAIHALATFLLFKTKWDPKHGSKLPKRLPIVGDVPLICKGHDCTFAAVCPVIKNMSFKDVDKLEGTQCRADKLLGVQYFTDIIRDLDIQPGQSIDLINAANLVRWLIYRRRIDWQLALEGLTIDAVIGLDRETGLPLGEKKNHPLYKAQQETDRMIDAAQKSLVASRHDRLKLATQFGKESDVVKLLFTQLGIHATGDDSLPALGEE